MTVTYSVNGKPIKKEELKDLRITRKDYIDCIESIMKKVNSANDFQPAQDKVC